MLFNDADKPQELWLITLIDLILLLTCFFVIIFAAAGVTNSSSLSKEEKSKEVLASSSFAALELPHSLVVTYNLLKEKIDHPLIKITANKNFSVIKLMITPKDFSPQEQQKIAEIINNAVNNIWEKRVVVNLNLRNGALQSSTDRKNEAFINEISNFLDYSVKLRNLLAITAKTNKLIINFSSAKEEKLEEGSNNMVIEILSSTNIN